jgi:hypothetical protein
LTCTTPAHVAGLVNVIVSTPTGNGTSVNGFEYIDPPDPTGVDPATGPSAGGTEIVISGDNFTDATDVTINGESCTSIVVDSDGGITCDTPANFNGTYDIVVTAYGSGTLTDGFTYGTAPTLNSVYPSTGFESGNTLVLLSGSDFTGTTGVTFGGKAATSVNVVSDTAVTCRTPSGTAGQYVDVVITNATGNDTLENGFRYAEEELEDMVSIESTLEKAVYTGGVTHPVTSMPRPWTAYYLLRGGDYDASYWERPVAYATEVLPTFSNGGDGLDPVGFYGHTGAGLDDGIEVTNKTIPCADFTECFILIRGAIPVVFTTYQWLSGYVLFNEADDDDSFVIYRDFNNNAHTLFEHTNTNEITGVFGLSVSQNQYDGINNLSFGVTPIPVVGRYLKVGFQFRNNAEGLNRVTRIGVFLR